MSTVMPKKPPKKFKKTKEYAAMNLINETLQYQAVNKRGLLAAMYELPKSNINALKKDITNEIILSTIDCDNLDELIAKVKASVTE
jgi:adenine-specific DNA glycosylase